MIPGKSSDENSEENSGNVQLPEMAGADPEPVDFHRDLQEVRRDIYENLRVLVAVAVHGAFYVAWVGIMILVHWVISLMGHLEYPANIIPDTAEFVVQLGVLYIIANHTWDFAIELTAYNRAKRARRATKRRQAKRRARREGDSGDSSAASSGE